MKPEQVWREFTEKLRTNSLSESDCEPIDGYCHGLYIMRPEAAEAKKAIQTMPVPRWEYGEDRLMFFVEDDQAIPRELRLDFFVEGQKWYLYFVEGFTIPIKSIDAVPFSDFPQMDRTAQAFAHADMVYTPKALTFAFLKEKHGIEKALQFFEDNAGSNSGAWVPYFRQPKSLVVLIAWIESQLNFEEVSIEEFSDSRCVVCYHNHVWFRHYHASTHMRNIISEGDYRTLFERIWRHRAAQGGWTVQFEYVGNDTKVILTK